MIYSNQRMMKMTKSCNNCYHSVLTIFRKNGKEVQKLKCGYENEDYKLKELVEIENDYICENWKSEIEN